ncbi:MAG: C25 family cysteine peptidase [Candidatus Fermentibacteria bacterium]
MKIVCLAQILFVLSFPAAGGSVTRTLHFDPADVSLQLNDIWTVALMPGFEQRGMPGTPLLPAIPEIFLLPDGAANITFSAVPVEKTEIGLPGTAIIPATELRPFSSHITSSVHLPDPVVYSSESPWPENPVISTHTGTLAGIRVASCLIQPWVYIPQTGSLSIINEIEVTVTWEEGSYFNLTAEQRRIAGNRINALEGTVEQSSPYDSPAVLQGDAQYLLICDSSFTETMEPLASFHEGRGYTVETAAVQDILSIFPGNDNAEKLRNFIKNRFLEHGTIFVLLAGDETLVPVRRIYTYCETYADTAAVDLYYADLDGTWDASGDGEYGQPDDSLDLYADVLLGRALFSTVDEAELFVQKNLTYQDTPPAGDWQTKAVLCGAVLFESIGYTSDKGCDSIAVEFPPYWEVNKFYEELPGGGFTEHIPVISSGTAWNHYAGHGNERGIYWHKAPLGMMTNWIASDSIHNGDKAGIHTSIACHPAEYIGYESCAEVLLNKPDGGGVAVLFNTSYGWEGHWPSLGASERMCIDLSRQVFGSQASSLGLAFAIAKDLRIPFMNGGYDRTFQSLLSWSAFMDPALVVMHTEGGGYVPPVALNLAPPYPNPAERDAPVSFYVDFDEGYTEVSVHDLSGRLMWKTYVSLPQSVSWEGTDSAGRRVPAGVYIISARIGAYTTSRLTTVLD